MEQELFEKVWGFIKFNELTPMAAKKAIQNDHLFIEPTPWGKCMDPTKVSHLFQPDGQMVNLTIQERERFFPKK